MLAQPFVENNGQWPEQVEFRMENHSVCAWFEEDGIVIDVTSTADLEHYHLAHTGQAEMPTSIAHHSYAVRLSNASTAKLHGEQKMPAYSNYFKGASSNWVGGAAHYEGLYYQDVYPNIDMRWSTHFGALKYDFILAPGAAASQIGLLYEGVDIQLSELGELQILSSVGTLIEARPIAYQIIDGQKRTVPCEYVIDGQKLSFELGEYDEKVELTIDPVLVFSTYSGSGTNNFGYTATYDNLGFLYSGSTAFGNEYPVTLGAYDESFNQGDVDIAISKFDTTGTFLVWSSYLGGSGSELPHSIIVNDLDELYLYGTSGSSNFPTTANAYDGSFNGGSGLGLAGLGMSYPNGCDIIVSKLSFDGTELLSSTFVGGSANDGINFAPQTRYNYADEIRGEIELDEQGRVLIASSTYSLINENDFPTTSGAPFEDFLGGVQDGVLFRMDEDLSELQWSCFIGGSAQDAAYSLALRSDGDIVVTGGTASSDLPVTTGVVDPSYSGETDAWIAIIDIDVNEILGCTYLGTSEYDQAYFVELDASDEVHLFGQTLNGDAFIENADYSVANSGQFITQLNADLSDIIWSTAFGNGSGLPNISPTAFLVDVCDRIYLSGWGGPVQTAGLTTNGLTVTDDAFQTSTDGGDFYLMSIADDASELLYASFFGGDQSNEHVDGGTSRFDRKGKVYQAVCAGCQGNDDFPTSPSDVVSVLNGGTGCNLAVFKIDFDLPAVIADFQSTPSCFPEPFDFQFNGVGGTNYSWDFGDGASSTDPSPSHVFPGPGAYEVSLIVSDPMSCNLADTLVREVFVFSEVTAQLDSLAICLGDPVTLGIEEINLPGLSYSWSPSLGLSNPNSPTTQASISESSTYTLTIDNGVCLTELEQNVAVSTLSLEVSSDTIICDGTALQLSADSDGQADSFQWSEDPDFNSIIDTDSLLDIAPLFSSTYYVMASAVCSETAAVSVQLASDFIAFDPDILACADELLDISVGHSAGDSLSVEWAPDALILEGQGSTQITVMTSASAWFQAEVVDESGCTFSDSIFVEISPLSFESVNASSAVSNIPLGGSAQLFATPPSGYDYQWTPTNGLSNPNGSTTSASPNSTTTYTVDIIDQDVNGACLRSDTVTIFVFEFLCDFPLVFVPNAFSPNGDGENDMLFVLGNYIEEMELFIYDRWGNTVFQSTDPTLGWDGTYAGKALDPAVYVYHLDVRCIDGQSNFQKGNITLIR